MRKLATAAISMSVVIFAANYMFPVKALPILATTAFVAACILLNLKRKWLRALVISLFAMAFGAGVFTSNYYLTTYRVERLSGETHVIYCKLTDYPVVYDDYCRAEVKLCTEGLPTFKAIVYDGNMDISDAEPGQYLSFTGKISAADMRYGDDYDYYNSVGIYLLINSKSEIAVTGKGFDLSLLPLKLNHAIADRIGEIFPKDTAPFMKSLMLGDKSELYEETETHRNMSHAGLMHIVAVSGMHIAFMMGIFRVLFGYGRKSSIGALIFVWLFVFVTGMSPSAVRAAIMQSFVLMAPILKRENDAVTSLSAALGFILVLNPYAASSVSLQLSFAATAGIMLLSPVFTNAMLNAFGEKFRSLIGIVATSAAGMIFTTPLVGLHFGYISLYSILSNVLALPAVSLCFSAGYLATAMPLLSLGSAVTWLVSWLARYIMAVAGFVASLPFAVLYLENIWLCIWVLLCYVFFILAAVKSRGLIHTVILPLAASLVTLFLIYGGICLYYSSGATITAIDVGQGQCIAAFSGDKTILIDCGGMNSPDNAGDKASSYLRSRGRNKLDVLVLTHLHEDHINGIEKLLLNMEVGMIIIPAGDNNLPVSLSSREIQYIDEDMYFDLGEMRVSLYEPAEVGDENERCLMTKISIGDYDALVTGDSYADAEIELVREQELENTELLIVGHHGSRHSTSEELLKELGGDSAIISVGYNNYGHPNNKTLERLAAYGYNVYRTDLSGNIEIRVG